MSTIKPKIVTDQWVTATWEEYIQIVDDPAYEKAKGYYHNGQMRIEIAALGHDHASDNTIVSFVINLFAGIRGIPVKGLTNCTFRKTGVRDCQPDISYYIGERIQIVPRGTNIISLDTYQPPDLAIELGKTTIADDLGRKRILYEDLEIPEYWVVDVEQAQITAFSIADSGSRRITQSQVLPGFSISILEEALQRNLQGDQSQVVAWLLTQLQ
ncbi:Uma2 family endonuclease [Microseira sp. BLCC-F43]|uniref:Uma2 family endonuclease n=1 Tax=Microseira sp. BLCC-F43 TaxID=3153602 RepID=UPI0035B6C7E4